MAFFDWNGDGKKDLVDSFMEYQFYKDSASKDSNKPDMSGHGSGISTIGAIVAVIGGLFLASMIMALLGLGDPPVLLIILLWSVCGTGLASWFDRVGF